MSNEAEVSSEPQATEENTQAGGGASNDVTSGEPKNISVNDFNEVKSALKAANSEAAEYRRKLRELEDGIKKNHEGKLEEEKKFKELASMREKENEALKNRIKEQALNTALHTEAVKAGMVDLELVNIIDREKLIFDDEKMAVHGASDVIAELKKTKPYLFQSPKTAKNPEISKPSFDNGGKEPTPDEIASWPREKIVAYYKKKAESKKSKAF